MEDKQAPEKPAAMEEEEPIEALMINPEQDEEWLELISHLPNYDEPLWTAAIQRRTQSTWMNLMKVHHEPGCLIRVQRSMR